MSEVSVCTYAPLNEALLFNGFCAGILPVRIQQPRTIISLGVSDFLALERGQESVVVAEDLDGDGLPESVRPLISNFLGLNHGLEITSKHLYASNSSHVYRWQYDPLNVVIENSDQPQLVINNINADGMGGAPQGHRTRTLAIDETENTLYVSVGSNANIDPDSFRSRIRRFNISDESLFPFDFQTGEVFADGVRNEVALEFDKDGILWGAMNAADRLYHPTLGGDIHDDNPAEEVHRFSTSGQNYGYPYCWREYNLPLGLGRGTAWAWPNASLLSKVISDEECRNFDQPVLAMQAHSAPLGMTFYHYSSNRSSLCEGVIPFPADMDGYVFVAFHGSWNRNISTGYKVVYFPITDDRTGVVGGIGADPTDLLAHNGTSANWTNGIRPVDVAFDACGRLLVTSDGTNGENDEYYGDLVIRIEYTQEIPGVPATPQPVIVTLPTNEPISTLTSQPALIASPIFTSTPLSEAPQSIVGTSPTTEPTITPSSQSAPVTAPTSTSTSTPIIELPNVSSTSSPVVSSTTSGTTRKNICGDSQHFILAFGAAMISTSACLYCAVL